VDFNNLLFMVVHIKVYIH